MKKYLTITAIAIFVIALAFGAYYLMNKDCSACNALNCLNRGSFWYVDQGFTGYCHYKVEVSGRNDCSAPTVHFQDLTDLNKPVEYQTMGYFEDDNLCITYRADIYLTSGHNYHIWFTCPFPGYYDCGNTGPQSCW